jgi:trk system potassium uptake protein
MLPPELILTGDGSSPAVLEDAGIEQAQALAAVTGEDETNLVITTLARMEFRVPRIIGRVNNPKNAWLYTQQMGVDVALNQADILAKLIEEEMSLGDMMTLLKLRKGEYSVVEEKVHQDSAAVGRRLAQLAIPTECVIAAIIRSGNLIIPHGDTVLETADEIIAVVHAAHIKELAGALGK